MNKNGLEHCPFCGNDDVELKQSDLPADVGLTGWSVECPCCQASGPHGDLKGARGQWNCWVTENRAYFEKVMADAKKVKA